VNQGVFQSLRITLTGPICECEEQDISWGLPLDVKGNTYMVLTCKTCEAKLTVPHQYLRASITCTKPYPGRKTPPPPPKDKNPIFRIVELIEGKKDEKKDEEKKP
jgi:hypothetical protein